MNIETMRKLILTVDTNQIPASFYEKRAIETVEQIAELEADWTKLKTELTAKDPAAATGTDATGTDAEIEAWAKAKG